MAEKKELLDSALKIIDDQRTIDKRYLVGLTEDGSGNRSLVFDDKHTFTKSMTTTEKIANLAEVVAFLARRLNKLES